MPNRIQVVLEGRRLMVIEDNSFVATEIEGEQENLEDLVIGPSAALETLAANDPIDCTSETPDDSLVNEKPPPEGEMSVG